MSKKKNDHLDQDNNEDMVSFVPGSSVIDIGELRRAQADDTGSLDDDAESLRAEMESDPELKKDVLEGFNADEANLELDHIAAKVEAQQIEELKEMEELSLEVADEMKALNDTFIAEDKLLEAKIAADSEEESIETEEMSEQDQELRSALPTPNEDGQYDMDDLMSCIEALLFYSDRPTSLKKLKEMLEMTSADDEPLVAAIEQLKANYSSIAHGFEIAEIAGGYQLRTKASKAPLLRKLAKVQVQRLSRGAMETLTIVAYKQPCTKDDIDSVRGVDSSHFIRTLMDRKLIEITGRSEAAGRPMIYATTDTFLEVFSLMDLRGLPPLREIEAMVPQMAAAEEGQEDPRVVQMRKLVGQMKAESNHLGYSAREDEMILQEIRDRVKSIDVTTPYLVRQKELADQGIMGADAEEILAREFGFAPAETPAESTDAPKAPEQLELGEHVDQPQAIKVDGETIEVNPSLLD